MSLTRRNAISRKLPSRNLSTVDKFSFRDVLSSRSVTMYTSVVLFALSGAVAAGDVVEAPSWLNDYSAARKQSASQQKPLAVVLASGNAGYNKLSRGGELSD